MNKTHNVEAIVSACIEKREELGLTYQQIETLSGVPASTVSKFFNRSIKSPTLDTILPIAEALGFTVIDINAFAKDEKSELPSPDSDKYIKLLQQSHSRHVATLEAQLRHKTKWLIVLAAVLFALMTAMTIVVIYDITHPNMGWVQYATSQFTGAMNRLKDIFTI